MTVAYSSCTSVILQIVGIIGMDGGQNYASNDISILYDVYCINDGKQVQAIDIAELALASRFKPPMLPSLHLLQDYL